MIIKIWRYAEASELPARPRKRQIDSFDTTFGCACYVFGLDAAAVQRTAAEKARQASEARDATRRASRYISRELSGKDVFGRAGHNLGTDDPGEQVQRMAVHAAATDLAHVYHYTWSHPPGVTMTAAQMRAQNRTIRRVLEAEKRPAIEAYHDDTQHKHGHCLLISIDPETGKSVPLADGWFVEAVHIAIAVCERDHGLQPEPNRRYIADAHGVYHFASGTKVADPHGKILRKRTQSRGDLIRTEANQSPDGALLQRVRAQHNAMVADNDAPAGEQPGSPWSLARYASIVAAPRIQQAISWDEVHRSLAPLGLVYVKSPSGAWLRAIGADGHVSSESVAAGKAYANAAYGKLSARLGEYQPAPADLDLRPLVMPRFNAPEDAADDSSAVREQENKAALKQEARELADHLRQSNKQQQAKINAAGLGSGRNAAIKEQAARSRVEQELAREFSIAIDARATKDRSRQAGRRPEQRKDRTSYSTILWRTATRSLEQVAKEVPRPWRERYTAVQVNGTTEYRMRGPAGHADLAFTETDNLVLIKRTSRQAKIDALRLAHETHASVKVFGTERAIADTIILAAELGIKLEGEQEKRAREHRDAVAAGHRRSILNLQHAWLRAQHQLRRLREAARSDRRRRKLSLQALTTGQLEHWRGLNRIAVEDAQYKHQPDGEPSRARRKLDRLDRNQLLLASSRYVHRDYRFLDDEALRQAFKSSPQHLLLPEMQQHLGAIELIQTAERRWIAAALLSGRVAVKDDKLEVTRADDQWAAAFWAAQKDDPTFRRLIVVSQLRPDRFKVDLNIPPMAEAFREARASGDEQLAQWVVHVMDQTAIRHAERVVATQPTDPRRSLTPQQEAEADKFRRLVTINMSADEQKALFQAKPPYPTTFFKSPWPRPAQASPARTSQRTQAGHQTMDAGPKR